MPRVVEAVAEAAPKPLAFSASLVNTRDSYLSVMAEGTRSGHTAGRAVYCCLVCIERSSARRSLKCAWSARSCADNPSSAAIL